MQIITLLSDLGTGDAAVSMVHATLLRHAPGAAIIPVSHSTGPYDLQQAAYLLLSSYKYFSVGTIHVLLTDVFQGDSPTMLLAERDGYFFIAPDNGILSLTFGDDIQNTRLCFEFTRPYIFSDWINKAGQVVETLLPASANTAAFQSYEIKKAHRHLQPKPMPDGIECNILYIDRYENVVLDITKEQFDIFLKKRPFSIRIMRSAQIDTLSSNYGDVAEGDPLLRANSAGYMEIAFNHAAAATALGLDTFSAGNLRYQTIKIQF